MTDDLEVTLAKLLKAPDRAPDEFFAVRMKQAVLADQRLQAARQRAWYKFASEGVAFAAVAIVFIVAVRLEPPGPEGTELSLVSPSMVGVILLALWAGVTFGRGMSERDAL